MSETVTTPIPKPRPKPAYAMVKIGARHPFRARILWDEYDERHPNSFAVLGPKDQVFHVHREHLTFLPEWHPHQTP